jgi:hypothetical protein
LYVINSTAFQNSKLSSDFLKKQNPLENEHIDDAYIDLSNYSIIALFSPT